MKAVQIDRTETGSKVQAKGLKRIAKIIGVLTRCQPDGFSITLLEEETGRDIPKAYTHIPAFWTDEHTETQLEAIAKAWVEEGTIPAICKRPELD